MTPTPRAPKTNSESPSAAASRYQQLRSHLAELKLHAAAEALPAVLDQASAEGLSLTVALERLLASRKSTPVPHDGWPAGYGSPACPPRPPWPTSTSTPPPAIDRALIDELGTCRYLEISDQHPAHRPTGD